MDMMEHAIAACEGISQLAQKRREYNDAFHRTVRSCGSCQHWMKRPTCPREGGIGSAKGGPSSGSPSCEQFSPTNQFTKDVAAFQAMPRPQ